MKLKLATGTSIVICDVKIKARIGSRGSGRIWTQNFQASPPCQSNHRCSQNTFSPDHLRSLDLKRRLPTALLPSDLQIRIQDVESSGPACLIQRSRSDSSAAAGRAVTAQWQKHGKESVINSLRGGSGGRGEAGGEGWTGVKPLNFYAGVSVGCQLEAEYQ